MNGAPPDKPQREGAHEQATALPEGSATDSGRQLTEDRQRRVLQVIALAAVTAMFALVGFQQCRIEQQLGRIESRVGKVDKRLIDVQRQANKGVTPAASPSPAGGSRAVPKASPSPTPSG
jgi:hypothetical protein